MQEFINLYIISYNQYEIHSYMIKIWNCKYSILRKLQEKDAEIQQLTSTAASHNAEIQKYQNEDLLATKNAEIRYLNMVMHDKILDMYKLQSSTYCLLYYLQR